MRLSQRLGTLGLCAALVVPAASCSLSSARVYCTSDTHCPEGSTCDQERGLCVRAGVLADGGQADIAAVDTVLVDTARPDGGARDVSTVDRSPWDRAAPDLLLPDRLVLDRSIDDGARALHCEDDHDCRLGCACQANSCVLVVPAADPSGLYCAVGPTPTCMDVPDLVVQTLADTQDSMDGVRSLREALDEAMRTPGPHRIVFFSTLQNQTLTVDPSLGPLPALSSLTYLDGGGVTLLSGGVGADIGIMIQGAGVAVSDLRLLGFTSTAIKVLPDAFDVHLFRLRIGDLDQLPNGNGVEVKPGSRRVWVGRGRELECVPWSFLPLPPDGQSFQISHYDINAIVANSGDGIRVEQASEVYIYGTWVGFDNLDPVGNQHDAPAWGNGQVGIHLIDVFDAVVGSQYLDMSEGGGRINDPLAAGVGVGRSGQGGVLIERGGEISMPGLILGDTPTMIPFDQNADFNLKIESTTGPVVYGRPPGPSSQAAPLYALSHSEGAIPILINRNQAEVLIWGLQNQCYYNWGLCPDYAVVIEEAGAPVRIYHTTNLHHFEAAAVRVGSLASGGSVELVNNIFWSDYSSPVVALEAAAGTGANIQLRHNILFSYSGWCAGDCPAIHSSNIEGNPALCDFYFALPTSPSCAAVDTGEQLSWLGLPLDQNGDREGYFNGSAPDLGARECQSASCLAVRP